ncbi:MAG: hypothetical protein ACRDHX_16805 [Chloroflexota bacterium]
MKREALTFRFNGETFHFVLDANGELHIARRGTPSDAIALFFEGATTYNADRMRYETLTRTHGIYWVRVPEDQSVLIISFFGRE